MNMMGEAARHAPQMMGSMTSHPMLGAGMGLLRNPLIFVAAGLAAGYLLHKYEKEIVETVAKATGMGKDFMLHQKENLDDLIAESQPAAKE